MYCLLQESGLKLNISFSVVVHRQANTINIIKEGMHIEMKHVRRKSLVQYLPTAILQKGKTNKEKRKSVSCLNTKTVSSDIKT